MTKWLIGLFSFWVVAPYAWAELRVPSIFGDSMVVQRDRPIRVWGWGDPGQEITVTLADKTGVTTASDDGRFDVALEALPAGGPHELTIAGDGDRVRFSDVLVGEVWICSGQSNMAWPVSRGNDPDLEPLAANFPQIRLISVPQVGTQEPQDDFQGRWEACSPESVRDFSAVGFYFGRQLHLTLGVPVGLIDNAWGGSAAEAWVRRDVLESAGDYQALLAHWDRIAENYDHESATERYEAARRAWIEGGRRGAAPRAPRDPLSGNQRPANIYHGVLRPTIGYTIRGVIWYQGESNASRAYQYRDLFPLMIQSWRDEWGQGDFPFYWVQLADFMAEKPEPGDSAWAELREAQTLTMSRLPNTGQAVIIDLGEAQDIHPRNKQDVGKRLARWALANDYGFEDLAHHSPSFREMAVRDGKAVLYFDHVGGGLRTFDVPELRGFTVAGADGVFVRADARWVPGTRDQIEVWAETIDVPVAVRYAWADNPVCNLYSEEGLPMTPFRTDDWPGVTQGRDAP